MRSVFEISNLHIDNSHRLLIIYFFNPHFSADSGKMNVLFQEFAHYIWGDFIEYHLSSL